MRYRLPKECTGVTYAGVVLERAADGTIEADDLAHAALAPHGIVPVAVDEAPPKAGSARSKVDDRRMLR